jgi:acylphosphatase
LYDGKVEIEAEAPLPNLQLFLDECKKGPAMSRVDMVYQSELPQWGYTNFLIK